MNMTTGEKKCYLQNYPNFFFLLNMFSEIEEAKLRQTTLLYGKVKRLMIFCEDQDKKMKSGYIIQRKTSPVKIAYYVQRMLEEKLGTKEIIYIISSQFGEDDVREFAKMYRYCLYIEDIRRIADLIYNIPKKDIDDVIDTVLHDILVKREILPTEYIREHFLGHKKR